MIKRTPYFPLTLLYNANFLGLKGLQSLQTKAVVSMSAGVYILTTCDRMMYIYADVNFCQKMDDIYVRIFSLAKKIDAIYIS